MPMTPRTINVTVNVEDIADRLAPFIEQINEDGRLACDILAVLIECGGLVLDADRVWRLCAINPAENGQAAVGIGSKAHELLDRLKERGPSWRH